MNRHFDVISAGLLLGFGLVAGAADLPADVVLLHGRIHILFAGRGYCNCAFALRGKFAAIDVFPGHGRLLRLGDYKV
jgi:hypothetical protein